MDFKKVFPDQYQPKPTPSVIDVPTTSFIAVDGVGDPNTSEDYKAAIEVLYALSYAIKMGNKAVLEYVVPPLEGFWTTVDDAPLEDKSRLVWTSAIRQPDFVDDAVFAQAVAVVTKKKPQLDTSRARLETVEEGLCVQALHVGPYDSEPETIAKMDRFAAENGYVIDMGGGRRHHEIYLSDPRKTAVDKLRTIIRHPVRVV